ncbi:DUF2975 domain-containing protein [Glycomyces scopariae]
MNAFLILMLRMALAAAFLAGLFGQARVVPNSLAEEITRQYNPMQVDALTTAAVLGIACVQAVLVAGWFLLGMIDRNAIFSPRAFLWVDVVIWATVAATVLTLGTAVYFTATARALDEMHYLGAMGSFAVCAGFGACFAMLMVIMKGLLRKATELQTEMAGVV